MRLAKIPHRESLQQLRHDNTNDMHALEKRKSYKHCRFLYNIPDTKTYCCSSSVWASQSTLSYCIPEVFTINRGRNTLLISDFFCSGGTFGSVSGRLTFQIKGGTASNFDVSDAFESKGRHTVTWYPVIESDMMRLRFSIFLNGFPFNFCFEARWDLHSHMVECSIKGLALSFLHACSFSFNICL